MIGSLIESVDKNIYTLMYVQILVSNPLKSTQKMIINED